MIEARALAGEDYQAMLSQCIHCGLCLQSCPTYAAAGAEMDGPRGRIAILRAVCSGRLPLSESVSRYIYDCLGCQSCRVSCPSGVPTDEVFAQARQIVASSPLFPSELAELEKRVRSTHNITGEPAANRLLWMGNLGVRLEDMAGKDKADVVLFTGCVSALYPMVSGNLASMVRLLRAAHVDFAILGSEEWCCGYPLLSAGLPVFELMEHNLRKIEAMQATRLVTTCPSCYHMWKYGYAPESFQVLHAVEFLADLAASGALRLAPLRRRVTYHDPCDLGRKSNVYDAPRRLLASIPGLELVEMKANRENALCCGGGGNLETLNVELSRAVANLRLEQAAAVGAEAVVSACQQCERTLAMAARRADRAVRFKVLDITRLLDEALVEDDGE